MGKPNQRSHHCPPLCYLSFISALGLIFGSALPVLASPEPTTSEPFPTQIGQTSTNPSSLVQAESLFEAGQYPAAEKILQQVIANYQAQGNPMGMAIASSNLALVYEQLGQWSDANQALNAGLSHFNYPQASPSDPTQLRILGQILEIKGKLHQGQGQAQLAYDTWQSATDIFTQLGDGVGQTRNQIHQAQALQSLGFYRRARQILESITATFQNDLDSALQVSATRDLGNLLRDSEDLRASYTALWDSLNRAKYLQRPEAIALAHLSLGQTLQALGEQHQTLETSSPLEKTLAYFDQAQDQYRQAIATTQEPLTRLQAQLQQLDLLIETQQWSAAQQLWPSLVTSFNGLPPSHANFYMRIHFGRELIKLLRAPISHTASPTLSSAIIAQQLSQVRIQAQTLGDFRAEAYALASMGYLYELEQLWAIALDLNQQALALTQVNHAAEITYEVQWQLGRIYLAQGETQQALSAYAEAVNTLQSLRSDLVATGSEAQFSFREKIEPLYRELVDLYLTVGEAQGDIDQYELARQTADDLKVAELDNFFREACLEVDSTIADDLDPKAAIIYPIILPQRLALIVRLPGETELIYRSYPVDQATINDTAQQWQALILQVNTPKTRYFPIAKTLYEWLIEPIAADLASHDHDIQTLVFVPDGILRNLPLAALHDGDRYLIELYAIALAPSLQLLESESDNLRDLDRILAAGVSKENGGMSALPFVEEELQSIQPETLLLNEAFTNDALQSTAQNTAYPIIHLATHGMFSSNLDQTYLLAWEGERLNIARLRQLVQSNALNPNRLIELLVLSACETAVGDDRAALGLAGIATRSGAKSTLATLWPIYDEVTATLMATFYQTLAQPDLNKAEALRQAQLVILQNDDHQHPYFWAAFILVGNWL